ncbi:MAG: prohibitin family protein [Thiomargarita sp.]|nr:prohibitin family protein [Thiomargarita sp.]
MTTNMATEEILKSETEQKNKSNWLALLQILLLVFLITTLYLVPKMVVVVEPGKNGVFWSLFFGGTQIDKVYSEGIHFILPWDKMYIYNLRFQTQPHELEVLTNRGLNVNLYLSIRYAPQREFLGLLHQQVGPDFVNIVVIPEVTAVLRETIGSMSSEEIYTTGRKVITVAINSAIEQVEQRFIRVDDVLIRKIDLPPLVEDSIKYKIQQKHLVDAHKFIVEKEKVEAERKRIEAEGISEHIQIISSVLPTKNGYLTWRGINATENLAMSNNAKVVLIGSGKNGLPIILNVDNPTDNGANNLSSNKSKYSTFSQTHSKYQPSEIKTQEPTETQEITPEIINENATISEESSSKPELKNNQLVQNKY